MNESGRDVRVRDGSEGEGKKGRWARHVQNAKEKGKI